MFNLISSKQNDIASIKSSTYQFNFYVNYYLKNTINYRYFLSSGIGFIDKDVTIIMDKTGNNFSQLMAGNYAIYLNLFAPTLRLGLGLETGQVDLS